MADETPKTPKSEPGKIEPGKIEPGKTAEAERKLRREATTIEGEARRLDPPPPRPAASAASGASALTPALLGGVAGAALATLVYVLLPHAPPAALVQRLDAHDSQARASAETLAGLDRRLAAAETAAKAADAAARSAAAGVTGATTAAKTAEGVAHGAEGLAMAAAGAAEAAQEAASRLRTRLDESPAAGAPDLAPIEARLARVEKSAAQAGQAAAEAAKVAAEARRAAAAGVPSVDLAPIEDRLAALERRAQVSLKPLEDRLAALENRAPVSLKPVEDRIADVARAGADRLAAVAQRIPAAVDLAPLAGRLEALEKRFTPVEGALAEQKSTARVAAEREAGLGASSRATALAVAAQSAVQALDQGRPYAAEIEALKALGASADRITPLARFAAGGAPTAASLADSFAPLAARVAANAAPDARSGIGDRLAAAAGRLVQVRRMGAGGDDAASLATRIEQALARGDVGEAFVAWARLPGPAKATSRQFGDLLSARVDAQASAEAILADAIAALGRKS